MGLYQSIMGHTVGYLYEIGQEGSLLVPRGTDILLQCSYKDFIQNIEFEVQILVCELKYWFNSFTQVKVRKNPSEGHVYRPFLCKLNLMSYEYNSKTVT